MVLFSEIIIEKYFMEVLLCTVITLFHIEIVAKLNVSFIVKCATVNILILLLLIQ